MLTNMTNMTIFKFLEYSCLQIWNADDGKVNVIDRICTCSKLIFQPESNGKSKTHRTKTVNQNKKSRAETTKSQKQTKENRKICEITYSIRIEGKTIWSGDFWVKIDPLKRRKRKGWQLGFEMILKDDDVSGGNNLIWGH